MKTVITRSLIAVFRTKSGLILTALALGILPLVQRSQAVNPPPDGGYAGGNTAEGQGAQQATIAELKSTLANQKKDFEVIAIKQQKEIESLTVGLQKVSAQVGVNTLGAKVIATKRPTGQRSSDEYDSAD